MEEKSVDIKRKIQTLPNGKLLLCSNGRNKISWFKSNGSTKEYIKKKYNKPGNVYLGLVHRLDRPVGGVMIFAKTSKAASRLTDMIKNHNISKKYL